MTEYRTIYADPPWKERGGGKCKRGADRHYPLMSLDDIHRTLLLCPELRIAEDAHCWLWVTNNFLPEGLELLRRLGFRYVTNTVWAKMVDTSVRRIEPVSICDLAAEYLQIGLGQYQRGAHELLLFGTRGNACVPATKDRLPSVVFAPRSRKHSEKPEVFRERIERVSPGPYLELFAREPRPGWTVWGNEV